MGPYSLQTLKKEFELLHDAKTNKFSVTEKSDKHLAAQTARDLAQLKKSLEAEIEELKATILSLQDVQKKDRVWVQKSFDERAKDLENQISASLEENTKTVETHLDNIRISASATRAKKPAGSTKEIEQLRTEVSETTEFLERALKAAFVKNEKTVKALQEQIESLQAASQTAPEPTVAVDHSDLEAKITQSIEEAKKGFQKNQAELTTFCDKLVSDAENKQQGLLEEVAALKKSIKTLGINQTVTTRTLQEQQKHTSERLRCEFNGFTTKQKTFVSDLAQKHDLQLSKLEDKIDKTRKGTRTLLICGVLFACLSLFLHFKGRHTHETPAPAPELAMTQTEALVELPTEAQLLSTAPEADPVQEPQAIAAMEAESIVDEEPVYTLSEDDKRILFNLKNRMINDGHKNAYERLESISKSSENPLLRNEAETTLRDAISTIEQNDVIAGRVLLYQMNGGVELTNEQIPAPTLIDILKSDPNWEKRALAARFLGAWSLQDVHLALEQSAKTDENLFVVKESLNSYQKISRVQFQNSIDPRQIDNFKS